MRKQKMQPTSLPRPLVSAFVACITMLLFSVAYAQQGPSVVAERPTSPLLAGGSYDPTVWAGEEFQYTISMMGGEAARAVLTIGAATLDANLGQVVPVQGMITSVGLLSAILSFRYAGLTYLDTADGKPIWSEKLLEDTGRSRTYTTYYDRDAFEASVTRKEGTTERSYERLIPSHVDDAFSWLFRLRVSDLAVGDRYTYYIFDGWTLRRMHIRVAAHIERYEDAAQQKRVMAAELVITADSMTEHPALPWALDAADLAPVFSVRRSDPVATAWISLDDRRIPLGIEVRTPIGFMRIALTRHVPPRR